MCEMFAPEAPSPHVSIIPVHGKHVREVGEVDIAPKNPAADSEACPRFEFGCISRLGPGNSFPEAIFKPSREMQPS